MVNGNFVNKSSKSGYIRQFSEMMWRSLIQSPARSSIFFFFFLSLLVGVFLSTRFLDSSVTPNVESSMRGAISATSSQMITLDKPAQLTNSKDTTTETPQTTNDQMATSDEPAQQTNSYSTTTETSRKAHKIIEVPLKCSDGSIPQTCPADYPEKMELDPDAPPPSTCPEYFRWIYEDLRPWQKNGIIREMVEGAKRTANFRLVISNGKAYVERFQKSWQTRDVFTLWGILQLLRKYPGRVPDLELMFDCVDWPVISKRFHWPNNAAPPPLFRYCGDDGTWDIVFPDWSFWGWAEINMKPWEFLSKELKEGNKRVKFRDREPYAYWKGNPFVAPHRMDLLKCNVTDKQDWQARLYIQDWAKEAQQGFKKSDLASQCTDRYKIYIEGSAWSVSEKYILACDSVALLVKPLYYDFFSRSLMPIQHYWPVRQDDKCRSIKFAVEWGNNHMQKAQAIGKAASEFVLEDLKMDYIYDYMLHLLTEYAKLLKFKPTIPKNAVELCSETMACSATDSEKKFMTESLVKGPSDKSPCTMPPPYDRATFQSLLKRKTDAVKQVEK